MPGALVPAIPLCTRISTQKGLNGWGFPTHSGKLGLGYQLGEQGALNPQWLGGTGPPNRFRRGLMSHVCKFLTWRMFNSGSKPRKLG